jgi:hypothetical protein
MPAVYLLLQKCTFASTTHKLDRKSIPQNATIKTKQNLNIRQIPIYKYLIYQNITNVVVKY